MIARTSLDERTPSAGGGGRWFDRQHRSRLGIHWLTVVFMGCLLVVGLDGWRIWETRASKVAEDEVTTANLARSLAQHAHDSVQQADAVVVGLRERVEGDGVAAPEIERLHRLMTSMVATIPVVHSLFIYDGAGNTVVGTAHSVTPGANSSDRPYFEYHRTHADREAHLAGPLRSKSDGGWMLTVSRRINTPDGRFAGVALATISIDFLQDFFQTFQIGHDGAILLATLDGIAAARLPRKESIIGTNVTIGDNVVLRTLLSEVQAHSAGSLRYTSRFDGVARSGSYHRVDQYPLVVVVAHGVDEMLTEWRRDAYRHFSVSVGITAGLALLAMLAARQAKRRQRAEWNYRLLADNCSDAIACIATDGHKLYASPAFSKLTGWSHAVVMAEKWGGLVHPDDRAGMLHTTTLLDAAGGQVTCSYRLLCADGAELWVEARLQRIVDDRDDGAAFVANIRDISKRKLAEAQVATLNLELASLAFTDSLTGLANRRRFDEALGQEWRRAARERTPLSLLMIDVDHFKLFNDRYGHQRGDSCLRTVSNAIAGCARRPADVTARYGGEEIALLLPNTNGAGALEIGERVRAAVEQTSIEHAGNPPSHVVTVSVGVATIIPGRYEEAEAAAQLVRVADQALYQAKGAGRNQVVVSLALVLNE